MNTAHPQETRLATPEEMDAFREHLVKNAIEPNLKELCRIANEGDIAFIVFEPDLSDPTTRAAVSNLTGLQGKRLKRMRTAIGQIDQANAARVFSAEAGMDLVAVQWARGRKPGFLRMFVITEQAALLLNLDPDRGLYLEPNSTDAGLAKIAN